MARPIKPHTKLTPAEVRVIRRLLAMRRRLTIKSIQQRFGVDKATIYRVGSGKTWADVQ